MPSLIHLWYEENTTVFLVVLLLYITMSPRYRLMLTVDIYLTICTGAQSQAVLLRVIMEQIINSIDEEIWTAKKSRKILPLLL